MLSSPFSTVTIKNTAQTGWHCKQLTNNNIKKTVLIGKTYFSLLEFINLFDLYDNC